MPVGVEHVREGPGEVVKRHPGSDMRLIEDVAAVVKLDEVELIDLPVHRRHEQREDDRHDPALLMGFEVRHDTSETARTIAMHAGLMVIRSSTPLAWHKSRRVR